jgi:ABC-type branched-subunit amino acid transport system ATPase component
VAPIIIEDVIIDEVMAALQRLSDEGVTLLLVEQNMHRAMELVARAWKRPLHEQEIGS